MKRVNRPSIIVLCFFPVALLVFLTVLTVFSGCDDLQEQSEDVPDLQVDDDDDGSGWEYPYYLVIGGGHSETLSLLTIKGPKEFSLANDVQVTASSINQTVVHQKELFAVCSLSHSVMIYDVHDLSIRSEVSVGIGNNPMALVFHNNKKAFISNFISNSITYYNLADDVGEALTTISLPSGNDLPRDKGISETWARPGGMILAAGKLYVALANLDNSYVAGGPGHLAAIDPVENTLEKTIELTGRNTVAVFAEEESEIIYAMSAGDYTPDDGYTGNGLVEVIYAVNDQVIDSIDTGGAPTEMVVNDRGVAFLGNGKKGEVLSFDTETLEILDPVDIRDPDDSLGLSFASALAVDGNGYLFAAEYNHDRLFVIDTHNNNKIVDTFTVNDGPDTLSFIR